MKKLEEMGNTLVNTALHYTHPNFSDMYPDWGVVCNIGETLIEMSNQPTLNENQQTVLDVLKKNANQGIDELIVGGVTYLNDEEIDAIELSSQTDLYEVLSAFAEWGLSEVAE